MPMHCPQRGERGLCIGNATGEEGDAGSRSSAAPAVGWSIAMRHKNRTDAADDSLSASRRLQPARAPDSLILASPVSGRGFRHEVLRGGATPWPPGRSSMREALHRHGCGRVVEGLLRCQFIEHRQGESQRQIVALDPGLDLGVGVRARHRQHLVYEHALVMGEFVAQHAACDRVPAAIHFQRVDLGGQPRQVQGVAEAVIDPCDVDYLELALPRDLDDVAARRKIR